ncbi:MAG: LytR C-terminal domain-containing protein, partial [Solirubrobacteraceae bacterium]
PGAARRQGAAAGRSGGAPGRRPPRGRRSGPAPGRGSLIAIGVVGIAVIAAAVILLTGSGPSPASSASSTNAAARSASAKRHGAQKATHTAPAVVPADVTVTVLNGTNVTNLAADVLSHLSADGYKPGTKNNASEQGMSSTVVGYTQPSYRTDALAVAKSLNLQPTSVGPVSQGDMGIACPSGSSCTTQVVVSVGQDLASLAG